MTLFIDRTTDAGSLDLVTVNVAQTKPITSGRYGTASLSPGANTIAFSCPQVAGSPRMAGLMIAFAPTSTSGTTVSALYGHHAGLVTWGDSGLATFNEFALANQNLSLTAVGDKIYVNNNGSATRTVYWTYIGLL